MKHKYCIPLLTFIAGIITGVVGMFVWQVFGREVEPKPTIATDDGARLVRNNFTTYAFRPPVKTELSQSLDDTQPIRVGETENKQRYADIYDTSERSE